MKIHFSILIIAFLASGCVNSNIKKESSSEDDKSLSILTEIVGNEYQTLENENGEFLLAWTERTKNNVTVTKYAVYHKEKKEILYSSSVLNGYVKWLSNTELEAKDMPGNMNVINPVTIYKIDVIKNKKTPLGPTNEK